MLSKLKDFYLNVSKNGFPVPFILDQSTGKASVTLSFAYIAFTIAALSTILLHFFTSLLTATLVSIGFWALATILYMFRSLHKAKIDLDDKSLELEGEEKNE